MYSLDSDAFLHPEPSLTLRFAPSEQISMHMLRFRRALRKAAIQARTFVQQRDPDNLLSLEIAARALLYALWLPNLNLRDARMALERFEDSLLHADCPSPYVEMESLRCTPSNASDRNVARSRRLTEVMMELETRDVVVGIKAVIVALTQPKPEAHAHRVMNRKRLIQVPIPFRDTDPPLQFARPGSGGFFGLDDAIHPTRLCNAMAIGGTGSGKTRTTVIPFIDAALRYRLHDGKRAAVLVIDPKNELGERVRATLAELGEQDRLVVVDGSAPPIAFFPPDSPLAPSERLAKLESFAPKADGGNSSYSIGLGMAFLRDLVQLDAAYTAKATHVGERLFRQIARSKCGAHGPASFWTDVRTIMAYARVSQHHLKKVSDQVKSLCDSVGVDLGATAQVFEAYTAKQDLIEQFNYVAMSASDTLGALLADPEVLALVDFDVRPDPHDARLNILDLIEGGKVLLFSPEMREGHRIAAQAIKAKWYEGVFARKDQERPIAVVIDEAQRFVTNDPETGEQAFLDRCRGFRCLSLLATQSLSSLKFGFGSSATAQAALDIVVANTPTKFVFRTTDSETVGWLRSQLPPPGSDAPHIVDVRRPAQLRPGEAYFLLADGTWGRRRADLSGLATLGGQH